MGRGREWVGLWAYLPRESGRGRIQPLGQILSSVPFPGSPDLATQSCIANVKREGGRAKQLLPSSFLLSSTLPRTFPQCILGKLRAVGYP